MVIYPLTTKPPSPTHTPIHSSAFWLNKLYIKAPTHYWSKHTSVSSSCFHIHFSVYWNIHTFPQLLPILPSHHFLHLQPFNHLLIHLLTHLFINRIIHPSNLSLPASLHTPFIHLPNPQLSIYLPIHPITHTCIYHSSTHAFTPRLYRMQEVPEKDTKMTVVLSFPLKSLRTGESSPLKLSCLRS